MPDNTVPDWAAKFRELQNRSDMLAERGEQLPPADAAELVRLRGLVLGEADRLASRIGSTGSATLPPTVSPPSSAPAQKLPETVRANSDLDDAFSEPLIKEDDRSTWKRLQQQQGGASGDGGGVQQLIKAIEALTSATSGKGGDNRTPKQRAKGVRWLADQQKRREKDAEKERVKAERAEAKAEKDRERAEAKADKEREKGLRQLNQQQQRREKQAERERAKAENDQAKNEAKAERERAKAAKEAEKEARKPPDEYDTEAGAIKDSIFGALPQGGIANRLRGIVEKTHAGARRLQNIGKPKGAGKSGSFWSRFKKSPKPPAGGAGGGTATKAAGTAAEAGGAEAGLGAAAGAEAAAGPVGWAVLFATAVAEFGKAAYDFAKSREAEIRRLAEVGPQQAAGIARLDAERVGRDIKTAQETGGSSEALTDALSKLEDALQPFESLLTDLANDIGAGILTVLKDILEPLKPLATGLQQLLHLITGAPPSAANTTTWDWVKSLDNEEWKRKQPRWPS